MSNSTKGIITTTNYMIPCPFRLSKGTHYLKLMRYHCVSIENTCCHKPSSIVTQSINIYDHFKVLPIGQSLLLILTHAQYALKVESPCSIVTW